MVLNRVKKDGRRLIDIDWQKQIVLDYIPGKKVSKELIQDLDWGTGIAFLQDENARRGLDVGHEGLLFGSDLIHASSVEGKVVKVNFWDYFFNDSKTPRFDGIVLFKIE